MENFKTPILNNKRINVLIVDDHPMTIWGYELTLKMYAEDHDWHFGKANNCNQAINVLNKSRGLSYQVVLLDINLPTSEQGSMKNGEDLGLKIKKLYPKIKIIVLTMLSDPLRIKGILKNLNPNGFIIKSQITPELLFKSIIDVLNDKNFYCEEVKKVLPLNFSNNQEITNFDREILYYLSIGEKMKNLPKHIPLSMASIERRKKKLKVFFGISEGTNRDLIRVASERGYL